MKMTRMMKPCEDCPFRTNRPVALRAESAEQIALTLQSDGSFSCHKTCDYGVDGEASTARAAFCAGAVGTMVNEGEHFSNVLIRLIAREDPAKLWPENIDSSELYPSLEEWVEAHYEED